MEKLMSFFQGFNQSGFFQSLAELLDKQRAYNQRQDDIAKFNQETTETVPGVGPNIQIPSGVRSITGANTNFQIPPAPTQQPIPTYDPRYRQAVLAHPAIGQADYPLRKASEPSYQVLDKGFAGTQTVAQYPGRPPIIQQVTEPKFKPTNPNEAYLAQDASNPNSPTSKISSDALDRLAKARALGQDVKLVQDTEGNYNVIETPKAGGAPSTYDAGVKGVIKGTARGPAKLVLDGDTGKARYKYMSEITEKDSPLSNQALNTGEMAGAVTNHIPDIRSRIDELDKAGKLGPAMGRWNEFLAGSFGAGDPDYQQLFSDISLVKSGLSKVHFGARGATQILALWDKILNAKSMDRATLTGGLNSVENWLKGYAKMGGNPTNQPNGKPKWEFEK